MFALLAQELLRDSAGEGALVIICMQYLGTCSRPEMRAWKRLFAS